MGMYEPLFSQSCVLNEQIARQIFDILPERGPIMVIMDREGNYWPSDSEKFSSLNVSESFLRELCDKVDDGTEPVVTQAHDCSIIVAQLATLETNCGYVIIAMPACPECSAGRLQASPPFGVPNGTESTFAKMDLIEILLNQVGLIAKLIEKNNILYERQMKHHSACPSQQRDEGLAAGATPDKNIRGQLRIAAPLFRIAYVVLRIAYHARRTTHDALFLQPSEYGWLPGGILRHLANAQA